MTNKPFIVAEMSANHLGSLDRALRIIQAAAVAGADAIKLQTWKKDTMVLDRAYRLESGPWAGRLLHELYAEAYTPWEWHAELYAAARDLNLVPFSSVFDKDSVDFLETLGCPIYKIASFEILDLPLIRYAASKGKPMMISTGMASKDEILEAQRAAKGGGCTDLTTLKCTSAYPARIEDADLSGMMALGYNYCSKIGLSDHSLGSLVAIAATALGASVIEKHLTLRRADGGPDAKFSMEPEEFAEMVKSCRQVSDAISPRTGKGDSEAESEPLRRSVYWARDQAPGDGIYGLSFATARPGHGIRPSQMHELIGKRLKVAVSRGTPVRLDQFE